MVSIGPGRAKTPGVRLGSYAGAAPDGITRGGHPAAQKRLSLSADGADLDFGLRQGRPVSRSLAGHAAGLVPGGSVPANGPGREIRTPGLMVPNHARYRLRYARIPVCERGCPPRGLGFGAGGGLYLAREGQATENGSAKALLVEAAGIEPASEISFIDGFLHG